MGYFSITHHNVDAIVYFVQNTVQSTARAVSIHTVQPIIGQHQNRKFSPMLKYAYFFVSVNKCTLYL